MAFADAGLTDDNEIGLAADEIASSEFARHRRRSTALITNIDFDGWADYLGDPPLAMALLDRLVEGATLLKVKRKSYRAAKAKTGKTSSDQIAS